MYPPTHAGGTVIGALPGSAIHAAPYHPLTGQRTSRTLPAVDGTTVSESWTYDNLGRLDVHTDFKGQQTKYVYDSLGRLWKEQRYEADHVIGTDDPDQTTEYHYDSMGNRDQVVIRNASGAITRVETYGYDAQNRLTSISASEGTIHYAYDAVTGQLTDTWTNTSGAVDPAEASTWMHYSSDSFGRLYQATARRLLATTVNRTTTYSYDKVGNLASVLQPNGVLTSYTYNPLNRLESESVTQGGQTLASYLYHLLPDGNREYVIETDAAGVQTRIDWTYDADDRLTREVRDEGYDTIQNGGDYTDDYALDLVGNRLAKDHDAVGTANDATILSQYNQRDQLKTTGPDADADGQPDAATATTYSYDANGSQDTKTAGGVTTTYNWDLQNHLASIDNTTNGTVDVSYRYNSDGVRVAVTANGQTIYYLNDPQNPTGYTKAIEDRIDTNADGTADTAETAYLLGLQVIGQADAGGSHYLLLDGHGSTRALTDLSGQVVARYDYDVYGVALNFDPNTAGTNWQFGGDGLWDPNSLFFYHLNRFREGDRFISYDSFEADPATPANLHKYVFASVNPVRAWDPSGHSPLTNILCSTAIVTKLFAMLAAEFAGAVLGTYFVVGGANALADTPNGTPGLGGKKITSSSLSWMRAEVRRKFMTELSSSQQDQLIDQGGYLQAFSGLKDASLHAGTAMSNWDIAQLYQSGFYTEGGDIGAYQLPQGFQVQDDPFWSGTPRSIPGTVTVDNRVYEADEVNYYLYGAMIRAIADLRGYSRWEMDIAQSKVALYRIFVWEGEGALQRQAWFRAGFYDDVHLAYDTALPNATPSGIDYNGPLTYAWGHPVNIVFGTFFSNM